MAYPKELKYTKDHEWMREKGGEAVIGITSYALEQLSDVVHLDLPEVGATFKVGDSFGTIESTKTVSDLYMPVGGKIIEVNKDLLSRLETIDKDPYDKGWLVKVQVTEAGSGLLTAAEYESFIAES